MLTPVLKQSLQHSINKRGRKMGVPKLANILTNNPLASEEEVFRTKT